MGVVRIKDTFGLVRKTDRIHIESTSKIRMMICIKIKFLNVDNRDILRSCF